MFQLPVVNGLGPLKEGQSSKPLCPVVNAIPDTFPFGINLTGPSLSRSAAGAIAQPFGTALTADEGRVAQDAFPAALTAEKGNLDDIFHQPDKETDASFPRLKRFCLEGGNCFRLQVVHGRHKVQNIVHSLTL